MVFCRQGHSVRAVLAGYVHGVCMVCVCMVKNGGQSASTPRHVLRELREALVRGTKSAFQKVAQFASYHLIGRSASTKPC